jgi:hypothetical protein
MAFVASVDSAFCGNSEFKSGIARGLQLSFGRITGSYGGALQTITIAGMNTPIFVIIPPVSGYAFQYDALTNLFAILVGATAPAAQVVFPTYSTSVDLSSFTCYFNGLSTVGVGYLAIGWGG